MATSFFTLAPVLVGAFIEHLRLSVRAAGVISSGELAGSALGSLLVLLYGQVLSVRTTLAVSMAVIGIANLGTAVALDFNTIALCRIAAGLGGGLAFSVVNAAAARARKPGHMFAGISLVQMMLGAVGFMVVPALIGACGLSGVFNLLGFGCLACAMAAAGAADGAPVRGPHSSSSLSLTPRGALLLASLFATYLTSTALWTYLERIAVAARLPGDVVSVGLSVGMIAGAAGSLGATLLLIRVRNTDAFVTGGVVVLAVSAGLLIKASAPAAYLGALVGFNGALSLVTPLYQTRLAAESGGENRILAALLAMYLGLILGPLLGAGLVVGPGYEDLIRTGAALFAAAALLAFGSWRIRPQMVRS
jgi:predicted MFS family arabinose efflux permease